MSHQFFKDVIAYTGAIYLGDPTADGSWRIIISGSDLLVQKLITAVWTTKQTIAG